MYWHIADLTRHSKLQFSVNIPLASLYTSHESVFILLFDSVFISENGRTRKRERIECSVRVWSFSIILWNKKKILIRLSKRTNPVFYFRGNISKSQFIGLPSFPFYLFQKTALSLIFFLSKQTHCTLSCNFWSQTDVLVNDELFFIVEITAQTSECTLNILRILITMMWS